MESGAIVLFRAVVMLSCLVLVPMAAIFGSAFPALIQSCLPDSWRTTVRTGAEPAVDLAPTFGVDHLSSTSAPQWPQTNSRTDSPAVRSSTSPLASAPAWPSAEQSKSTLPPARAGGNYASAQPNQAEVSTVFSAPAETPADRLRNSPHHGNNAAPTVGSEGVPADALTHGGTSPNSAPAWPSTTTNSEAQVGDRFTEIEQRLRGYGAVHYHLETWGQGGELYRFQCQMPPATAGGASPAFEAIDANALEAMQRVLQQVETLRKTARQ